MLERVFVHGAWSFQRPHIQRPNSAGTYLGITDEYAGDDSPSLYLAKDGDEACPADFADRKGEDIFGKVFIPSDQPEAMFPGIELYNDCDNRPEWKESPIQIGSIDFIQCPRRSRLFLKMCQKNDKEELEYAEEVNTASLLYWFKIVLCEFEEEGRVPELWRLKSQLVNEDKLFESLYQPYKFVESMVDNMERLERACKNMRNALRPPAMPENSGDSNQKATARIRTTVIQPVPAKQQSHIIRLRLSSRRPEPANGQITAPSQIKPTQSMQDSQDVAPTLSSPSEPLIEADTDSKVSTSRMTAARTTTGDEATTESDLYVIKERESWGRVRKPHDRYSYNEIKVDWIDNPSNPHWEGYTKYSGKKHCITPKSPTTKPPTKKRKVIKVETDDGDFETQ
jgi:hypothetical protein